MGQSTLTSLLMSSCHVFQADNQGLPDQKGQNLTYQDPDLMARAFVRHDIHHYLNEPFPRCLNLVEPLDNLFPQAPIPPEAHNADQPPLMFRQAAAGPQTLQEIENITPFRQISKRIPWHANPPLAVCVGDSSKPIVSLHLRLVNHLHDFQSSPQAFLGSRTPLNSFCFQTIIGCPKWNGPAPPCLFPCE